MTRREGIEMIDSAGFEVVERGMVFNRVERIAA